MTNETCERIIERKPCTKVALGPYLVEQVSGTRRVRLCVDCLDALVSKAKFSDGLAVYTDEGKAIR